VGEAVTHGLARAGAFSPDIHHQAGPQEIEALAKRRLADEYDAAQERGEVASRTDSLRQGAVLPKQKNGKASAAEIGLSSKEIHEARQIRDAAGRTTTKAGEAVRLIFGFYCG
jgi:hypothetical protein